jgi:hypothetical protein
MIKISKYENNQFYYIVVNNDYIFGEYRTEKRALEILDEIQRLMIASLTDKNLDGYGVVIYQMPEE